MDKLAHLLDLYYEYSSIDFLIKVLNFYSESSKISKKIRNELKT